MKIKSARLSDLLRARAPSGAPVELLLDSWSAVEDAVLADSAHAREDLAAASDALPPIAGVFFFFFFFFALPRRRGGGRLRRVRDRGPPRRRRRGPVGTL